MLLWITSAYNLGFSKPRCHDCGGTDGLVNCVYCAKPVCPDCRWGFDGTGVYQCNSCEEGGDHDDETVLRKQLKTSRRTASALTALGSICGVIAFVLSVLVAHVFGLLK